MLVLSREQRESIIVSGPEGGCLLTVQHIRGGENAGVSLLISHSPSNTAGAFDAWTVDLARDAKVKVGSIAEVTVVDVRGDKVRLGISTSKETSVHRLEVGEAIPKARAEAAQPPDNHALVLSRQRNDSIIVSGTEGGCLLTVLRVQYGESDGVSLLISHSPSNSNGEFDAWTADLTRDTTVKIGSTAKVTLVDVRAEKVRLAIDASREFSVHRLEVWEAIKQTQDAAKRATRRLSGDDAEDGPAGSRVPRPTGPKPPSLDVRLNEPPEADGDRK